MFDFLSDMAAAMLSSVLQMAAGSILAIILYFLLMGKNQTLRVSSHRHIAIMIITSVAGMILPLNLYGIIPVVGGLYAAGFKYYSVLPMILANFLFNTSMVWDDPFFTLSTGIRRSLAAFFVAVLAGILLKTLMYNENTVIRLKNLPVYRGKPTGFKGMLHIFNDVIGKTAIYMILGVLIHVLFHQHIYTDMISFIYSNSYTASIPAFFMKLDVFNPFFEESIHVLFSLLNLTGISALLILFKPKAFFICLSYFAVCAVFIALPALF